LQCLQHTRDTSHMLQMMRLSLLCLWCKSMQDNGHASPCKSTQVYTSPHHSRQFYTSPHNVPHTYKGDDDDDDDDLYCWVKGGCHKKGVQVIMCSMAAQVHARQWPLKSTQVHTSLHKSTPFRHRDGTLLCLVDISVSCGHKAGDEEQQT
jgi:hypothetical protein